MNALSPVQTAPLAHGHDLAAYGIRANENASLAIFTAYQERRPANTQRSQRAALALFAGFMRSEGIAVPDLYADPWAWQGITWGVVRDFQTWLLRQGYSMKTVNDRVSAVKVYMSLANQAGVIPDGEILRLQSLRGYTRKEAIDMDAKRARDNIPTRRGSKKEQATLITQDQARTLCKVQANTPQARRDALIMCLLLDHGLRVSELAGLEVENVDKGAKLLTWYRPKTGRISKHALRGRAWQRMNEYLARDNTAPSGSLLLASTKSGALKPGSGMSIEAIAQRVRALGLLVDLPSLSPHDCRHYGATMAGNDPNVSLAGLMQWGDWDSPASAARYINRGQADNDGVSLGMD